MKKWWSCVTVGHEIFSAQSCSEFQYRNQVSTLSTSGKTSANVLNSRVCKFKSKKDLHLLFLLRAVCKPLFIFILRAGWWHGYIFLQIARSSFMFCSRVNPLWVLSKHLLALAIPSKHVAFCPCEGRWVPVACVKSEMICGSGLPISKWEHKHGSLSCSWSLHTKRLYICLGGGREDVRRFLRPSHPRESMEQSWVGWAPAAFYCADRCASLNSCSVLQNVDNTV